MSSADSVPRFRPVLEPPEPLGTSGGSTVPHTSVGTGTDPQFCRSRTAGYWPECPHCDSTLTPDAAGPAPARPATREAR